MDKAQSKVLRRIDEWKLKLIDLSRRNRLVNFRPTRSSNTQFDEPGMNAVFERLVTENKWWEIWMPPAEGERATRPRKTQVVPSTQERNQLERILRNLARRSASEYRERGIRVLYVTFGMLRWVDSGTSEQLMSPIALTPVELTRKTTRDPYRIQIPAVEDEVILNPALKLKLQYDHNIELPPLPDFEERTLSDYLDTVQAAVEGTGWYVEPTVQLGLFSFYKLVMYHDLEENANIIAEHPLIKALAGVAQPPTADGLLSTEGELDGIVDPKGTYQVLDADSSQQLCIQYALGGQSFVMHGPPGTGKSQTIANMISEFIAAGKSVLFVSEKMAALEVVYSRLKAKNLDDFCLELHSHKANKREVVAELKRSMDEHLSLRGGITDEELSRLASRRDQLNAYVEALHIRRQPMEMSAYELFGRLARLEEAPFLPSGYPVFNALNQARLFELEEKMRRLTNAWAVVEEGQRFPWRGCREERFTPETRSSWMALLDGAISTIEGLEEATTRFTETLGLETPKTTAEYERLQRLAELITATPRPPMNWFEDVDLDGVKDRARDLRKEWEAYWNERRALKKSYDSRFLVLPPGTADRIEGEWSSLKEVLKPASKGDGNLLKQMTELNEYATNLRDGMLKWKKDADATAEFLGLKTDVETPERAMQLSQIADLCEGETKPERAWLDMSRLQETRALLESLREHYSGSEELRGRLDVYTEELLTLDLDRLIGWYEGSGKSFLRFLNPSHYSIQGTVSRVSRSGSVPETILDDLKTARELVQLQRKLAEGQEDAKKALGSYYTGDRPDFEAAEKALETAETAIKIAGRARAPKALRDNLAAGTKPGKDLLEVGHRLRDSLAAWRKRTREVGGLVPPRRIPTSGKSLEKSTFKEIDEWAYKVGERLGALSRTSAEALATRKTEHPPHMGALILDLRRVEGLQRFEDHVEGLKEEMQGSFGHLYAGLLTDWDAVAGAVDWTKRVIRALSSGVPDSLKRRASDGGGAMPANPGVSERLEKLGGYVEELNGRFEEPIWKGRREAMAPEKIMDRMRALRSRIDDLQTWVDYNTITAELSSDGLGALLEQMIQKKIGHDVLLDVFHKSIYQGFLDMVFSEDINLSDFRGKEHEQLIDDFQELDRKFIRLSAQRVIEAANEHKPQGVFVVAPDSEITILRREATKKSRHMPLRELFERIPNLIWRLKPCLMMSPISVSQFLKPGAIHFDLVVFDEASQIYTEDAVGSIYRGDRLVVAGDPKQLPPTPFFQYSMDEDFDWDAANYEFDVFDSVLDECMSIGLPVKMLRWHYRSRHDSLISFSNDRYYDGRLVLFPASRMGAEDLGLEFVYVEDGVYQRGRARNNPREAEVVADLVFDHFQRHPDKTLGVVTFSLSQMNTVQDAVERRLRDRPKFEQYFKEDRLNGFFVKNLENVQGDERDVMIFSVGYGRDEDGRITMNFGPLNKQGGERRLNVAITRAREKVVLVSSIKYDDIKLTSTQAEGVHSLHYYLRYAERRPKNLEETRGDAGFSSPLEMDVAEEVEGLGYEVVPSVGSSSFRVDLGVVDPRNPGRFILGIMCDGDTYREASMARDRDRLRNQVLENLGWRIHRIWSPDWVQRRSTELKRLRNALKDAERGPRTMEVLDETSAPTPVRTVERGRVEEARGNDLPEVEPYRFARLRPDHLFSRYSAEFKERYMAQYHAEVKRLLPQLVAVEGPIHRDLAYRRLNTAFRLSRATQSFADAFFEEIDWLVTRDELRYVDGFLWPVEDVPLTVRVPVEGVEESFRAVEHIPPVEIGNAVVLVVGHSLGISGESLLNETAKLLGFKRMTESVSQTVTGIIGKMNRDGVLKLQEGLYTLSGKMN